MQLTIRYCKYKKQIRAIVPEIPITVVYGATEKEARRKIMNMILRVLALIYDQEDRDPKELFTMNIREEYSYEGY